MGKYQVSQLRTSQILLAVDAAANDAYWAGRSDGLNTSREDARINFEHGRSHREREIITLLKKWIPDPHSETEECSDCKLIRDLIALIKGENK